MEDTDTVTMSTFYFAWVDDTETTFGPEHVREDEKVFSFRIQHTEGEVPAMLLEIQNPRRGLLAAGYQIWAWLAWENIETGHAEPLFFGRLIGIPNAFEQEVVELQFIAQSHEFNYQKQTVAETLKVRPYYDPVFLQPSNRDEPDSIIEGYSALWHVDRTTLEVSVSDIIDGEDGTEIFTEDEAFYDSVQVSVDQPPLQGINVDAVVTWTQEHSGIVDFGQKTFFTYTGGGLIEDWPKPGTTLGGGWSVLSGLAYDTYGINTAVPFTYQTSFRNHSKEHSPGDTMAVDWTSTEVVFGAGLTGISADNIGGGGVFAGGAFPNIYGSYSQTAGGISIPMTAETQSGVIAPSDPDFHDIPTSYSRETHTLVPIWRVDTNLVLRYDAMRPRSEHLVFTLMANVQPLLTPPQSPAVPIEETIKLTGVDVGLPLANVLDWLSIKGQAVSVGQVMYPNQPTIRGGTTYQICTVAGTAGDVQPTFSHVVGQTTIDGTVEWTSLGQNLTTSVPDWTPNTFMPVGQLIRPLEPVWARWTSLVPTPRVRGVNIARGQICKSSNGAFHICLIPGSSGREEPSFGTSYGSETEDYQVTWRCIGSKLPDGTHYFICDVSGTTDSIVPPNFNNTVGATFSDGSVTWKSLGTAGTFIDVPIGDLSRRSYFPTDRGLWSLEYLIAVARARLRLRSRAISIGFDCKFERAVNLSCRKNVQLFEPRLPGGSVTGKVTAYQLSFHGDTKEIIGHVIIGCAVGYNNIVHESTGTPVYVDEGYVDTGYQFYEFTLVPITGSEVGYSIPEDAPNDDGLVFPLRKGQAKFFEKIWGSLDEQLAVIEAEIPNQVRLANLQKFGTAALFGPAGGSIGGNFFAANNPLIAQAAVQSEIISRSRTSFETALAAAPIWYDLQLNPVTNGPFNTEYQIIVSELEIKQDIDLEAPSSP